MDLVEDFTAFFGGFAVAALLAGEPVRVIYDGAYAEALGMGGASTRATLPTTSVPAAWEGMTLEILAGQGAGRHIVRNHEPDGTGMSVLLLERAA